MKPHPPYVQAFAIIILILWVVPAFAGEPAIIKRDPLRSDRYQITDSRGNHTETLKRDPLDTRRILITSPKGEPVKYIKPSILPTSFKRFDTFTPSGDHAGTIRQDVLRNDRYRYKGKTIRRDHLRNDRWIIEK